MPKKTPIAKKTRTVKPYTITVQMNGVVVRKKSDNIEETIMALKPEQLHTEMYISIKKGNDMMDRRLSLIQGKRFFAIDTFREVFISNLLLA